MLNSFRPAHKFLNANICWHFNIYEQENSLLNLSEPKKCWVSWYIGAFLISCSAELSIKKFYNLGAWLVLSIFKGILSVAVGQDQVVEGDYGFCGYLLIIISALLLVLTFPFSLCWSLKVSLFWSPSYVCFLLWPRLVAWLF